MTAFTIHQNDTPGLRFEYTPELWKSNPEHYTKIGTLYAEKIDDIFVLAQNESPEGARRNWLDHAFPKFTTEPGVRSLCVGDVVTLEDGTAFMVARVGWERLNQF